MSKDTAVGAADIALNFGLAVSTVFAPLNSALGGIRSIRDLCMVRSRLHARTVAETGWFVEERCCLA